MQLLNQLIRGLQIERQVKIYRVQVLNDLETIHTFLAGRERPGLTEGDPQVDLTFVEFPDVFGITQCSLHLYASVQQELGLGIAFVAAYPVLPRVFDAGQLDRAVALGKSTQSYLEMGPTHLNKASRSGVRAVTNTP